MKGIGGAPSSFGGFPQGGAEGEISTASEVPLAARTRRRHSEPMNQRDSMTIRRLTRALYAGEDSGESDGDEPDVGEGRLRWRLRPHVALALLCVAALAVVGTHIYGYVRAAQSLDTTPRVGAPHSGEYAEGVASSEGADPPDGAVSPAPSSGHGKKREGTTPSPSSSGMIVYVTGKVTHPGIVRLPDGARVHEALDAAGGALGDADLSALNLARPLMDGEQIWVGAAGEQPPGSARSGSDHGGKSDCVNLASADERALQELDGVGPALAARIVRFRQSRGSLTSVDELMEVSGIGRALIEKIRVGAC